MLSFCTFRQIEPSIPVNPKDPLPFTAAG